MCMSRQFFIIAMLAVAWLGVPQPGWSQGTIAYYQPASPIILWTEGLGESYPFDIDANGSPDLTFVYWFQAVGVQYQNGTRSLSAIGSFPDIWGNPQPLPSGFLIGPDSSSGQLQWFGGFPGQPFDFASLVYITSAGASGEFAGQHAYMGLEFQRAGATHYGWIQLQISSDAAIGAIESWAWETRPGEAIVAGAVPEPSTWALVFLGIVLLAWHRGK